MSTPITPDLSARIKDALNPGPVAGVAAREDHESHEDPAQHPACRHCNPAPTLAALLLPCPECGADEASIDVKLGQLDCEQFHCNECDVEFSIHSVEARIAKWQKVISWVRAVPQFSQE